MISRRDLLGASLGGMMAPWAAGAGKRPNFVFLLADDMGWGDLPSYGHRSQQAYGGWTVRGELQMPNLERMARRGVRFAQYYVAQPVCSASRCGLMTGQFPNRLGIHDYLAGHELNVERGMPDALDPATPTMTSVLGKAGYATAHYGKWHLSPERGAGPKPTDYGIGSWDACLQGRDGRVRSSEVIADRTIEFLERHKDEPFYINAWLYDPHSPLHPTEEMMAPYEKLAPGWGPHKGALQVYYSVLTNMDKHVGRILDKLDELGLAENTVVIFSSDNGPENGIIPFTSHHGEAASAGPFRGVKRSLYEGGIRLPFLVQWPGKVPQGKVDQTTILGAVDLVPTLCRLAGVATPKVDGEDLSAALLGTPVARRRPLLWEWREPVYGSVLNNAPMLAMREGKWKLLMNPDRSRVELYDIPRDPSEVNNRADREPETVRRLASRLLAWQKTLPRGPIHPEAGRNDYPWPKDY